MENRKQIISKLIDYYLTGSSLTQEEHNAVILLDKEIEALILPVVVRQSEQLKEKDVMTFDLYKNKYYTKRGDVYFNKITNSYYSEKELKENYEDY